MSSKAHVLKLWSVMQQLSEAFGKLLDYKRSNVFMNYFSDGLLIVSYIGEPLL